LVAALFVLFYPAAARAAQGPKDAAEATTEVLRAAVFGENAIASDLWLRFHRLVEYERWTEAAVQAQRLAGLRPAALFRPVAGEPRFLPARAVMRDFFQRHPEMLEEYRRQYDPIAEAFLAEFRRERNPAVLEQVAEDYPFSSVRREALRLLADLALDRRDFGAAADFFDRLRGADLEDVPLRGEVRL